MHGARQALAHVQRRDVDKVLEQRVQQCRAQRDAAKARYVGLEVVPALVAERLNTLAHVAGDPQAHERSPEQSRWAHGKPANDKN